MKASSTWRSPQSGVSKSPESPNFPSGMLEDLHEMGSESPTAGDCSNPDSKQVRSVKWAKCPVEDQTTVRVPRSLRNKLKKIAALESVSVFELVAEVLQAHVDTYERALGTDVNTLGLHAHEKD